jgi:TPR repeat protein
MKTKQLIFATFLVIVTCPVSAWAQQVTAADLAKEANNPGGDPAQDFKGPVELLNAAKRGDTSAQLEIAILYEYGYDMRDNKVYALAWYILAADGGSAKAATHRDKLMSALSAKQVERAKAMSKTLVKEMPKQPTPPSTPSMPMQEPAASGSPSEGATPPPAEEPMPMPIPDEAPEKQ